MQMNFQSVSRNHKHTSTMRTPGMIGLSGKCPGKKLSLIVTFFIATADTPGLYSITLSTKRNGKLTKCSPNQQSHITLLKHMNQSTMPQISQTSWFQAYQSYIPMSNLFEFIRALNNLSF